MERRVRRVGGGALALALGLLGGCSAHDPLTPASAASPLAAASEGPTTVELDAPRFPVTIDHDFGSTTIEAEPTRIVALDAEEDTLAALGLTPLTYTPAPGGVGAAPWLGGELDTSRSVPIDVAKGVDLAAIADLHPDLILRTRAFQGSRAEYRALAAIAPTVYVAYGEEWQRTARTIGAAVGRGPEVEAVIAATEAEVARVGTDRPGLEDHTFAVAYAFDRSGLVPLDAADPATAVLTDLGLRLAPGLRGPDGTGRAELDWGDLRRVDADLLLLAWADDNLERDLTDTDAFRDLRAGTYARLDLATLGQLRNPTLRSLPWALGQLADALDRTAAGRSPSPAGSRCPDPYLLTRTSWPEPFWYPSSGSPATPRTS